MADFTSSNSRGGLYEAGVVLSKLDLQINGKSMIDDLGPEDDLILTFIDNNDDSDPITLNIYHQMWENDDVTETISLVELQFDESQRKQMIEYFRQIATILERKV